MAPAKLPTADLPVVDAVVVAAMDEEVAPYTRRGTAIGPAVEAGGAWARPVAVDGVRLYLVRSGIGLVNAAAAATAALGRVRPAALLSTGSAGGLAAGVQVGDVVVGDRYTYASADATAFGYALGQVPGMPVDYPAAGALLAAARRARPPAGTLRVGGMVSGDSFVTATTVADVRSRFPDALSTDMETTALAQVARSYAVPFLSVRGISDLCGPAAGEDFHLGVDQAAERAAAVVLAVLAG
ncbi:5'-methylthioadenosine/S-adenosylhomocysteine nucleosidase [Georgenia sp. TF02-10]|uniref:5'-methylthioadenosine/S-adenosylhomocysteine nucleosidase n=1 Tax=Georgenia sp. TF02-10 TaxID=2917725 RepID=UPI001FA6C53E|nr:5'-methylthioadenosine/S-adenosylhomocysteine nucleosidase [Georgenia sp. TF02-10]UNX55010.1 5'-methylthioadenosine/S-adenosylhomocysteine nucleosidase [Georgenia sp. TF02-10]